MIPAPPLLAGDPSRLGRYTLIGRLGQGGMGVVYLGRDEDGRLVAIKVIRPELAANPDYLARFRLEVELGRKVNGPFVAEVLDAGFDSERPYLVTAYIEGTTLRASVRERGPMPPSEVAHLAVGTAAALSAIHAAGLVHRDLKPGNVLLSAEGPRVIDFGVARAVRDRAGSLTGAVRPGTAEFMAPEQFEDVEVGPAVDVFAWGGLLVYASTGLPPFGDKAGEGGVDALERRVRYHQPDLGALEHPLRELVGAAMAKLPSGRPTAQALVTRLLAGAPLPRDHRAAPGVGLLVVTVGLPVSAYRGLNDRWWVAFDDRGLSLLKGAGPGGYGPFHLHNASAIERFPTDRGDLPGLVAGMLERGVAVGGRSEGRRAARCLPLLFTPAPNAPPSGGDWPPCDGRLLDDPPRVAVPRPVALPLATEHPPALLAAGGRLLLAWT